MICLQINVTNMPFNIILVRLMVRGLNPVERHMGPPVNYKIITAGSVKLIS